MAASETSEISEILRRGWDDFRDFVNPLVAIRAELSDEPYRVVRVEDGLLVDDRGRRYEDLHGTQAFGHRNRAVAAAVRRFLDSDACSWYPARVNPFGGTLARRLCERSGGFYSNVYFGSTGSEAVEAALKLARAATGRPRILALRGAYHGCTYGSCALMTPGPFRDPFAPHLPGVEQLPFGDEAALARALGDDVAAVVVEPVQLEGGVRPLPASYVAALCALTEKHGALLVADEVQTGMGRSGRFLLSEGWPRRPECALVAKQLGGGLMPIAAMLTHRALHQRAYGNFHVAEAHNATFSGNALACVAALAALDLLDEATLERNRTVGEGLRRSLREATAGHPLVDEIRGEGMIAGVALRPPDHPWLAFSHLGLDELDGKPAIGFYLCHRMYRRGFFCFVCGNDWSVLRLQPRFDIPVETLGRFVSSLREELDALSELA